MKIDKNGLGYDPIEFKYGDRISKFTMREEGRDPNYYFLDQQMTDINKRQMGLSPSASLKDKSRYFYKLLYTTDVCNELIETINSISSLPEDFRYICFNGQIELSYKYFETEDGYNDIPIHSRFRGGYAIPKTHLKDIFQYSKKDIL